VFSAFVEWIGLIVLGCFVFVYLLVGYVYELVEGIGVGGEGVYVDIG